VRFPQFIALTWLALVFALASALAEKRVALVVGNSAYTAANLSLTSPLNDAQDMTNALKDLGFEVVTAIDATKREMDLALQQFARLAMSADSALFFYAGHALQYRGRNYLMPTDARLEDESSIGYETVSLDDVRAALDRSSGVKIMFLDASRHNPLALRLQSRRGAYLLPPVITAPVNTSEGMVVAFATAADDVAKDGTGRNSPFTSALLRRLQDPGVEIGVMHRNVTKDVERETNGPASRNAELAAVRVLSEPQAVGGGGAAVAADHPIGRTLRAQR
jgi:uncharacterized caspase-like protein